MMGEGKKVKIDVLPFGSACKHIKTSTILKETLDSSSTVSMIT